MPARFFPAPECEHLACEIAKTCCTLDAVHLLTGFAFPNLVLPASDSHPAFLEYLHHLILTQPPAPCPKRPSEEDVNALFGNVKDLFASVAMSRPGALDPSDRGADHELTQALALDALYVRGKSYLVHQLVILEGISRPIDDWLGANLGISSDILARTARWLFESLRTKANALMTHLREFNQCPSGGTSAVVMESGLFRLSPPDEGVRTLLRLLSATPGGKPAPSSLLPGIEWATSRDFPVLAVPDGLYCFNPQALVEELPRLLGKWIKDCDQAFFDKTYARRREQYVAREALACLVRALPGAQAFQGLYYGHDPDSRAETDGLVIYDDVAIVIEAKAKPLSLAARQGRAKRLKRDFGELVNRAFAQARRAAGFIREHPHAEFTDEHGRTLLALNGRPFRRIFLLNPVLDAIDPISIELGEARHSGLLSSGTDWPWTVSISDLCVVTDVLDSPSVFLLYVDRRLRFNVHSAWFHVHDELDLLDYFLRTALFLEQKPADADDVVWQTDSKQLDQFYAAKAMGTEPPPKPRPPFLPGISALVNEIEASGRPGRTALTSEILALGEEDHRQMLDVLSLLPSRLAKRHRPQSGNFVREDVGLSLWFTEAFDQETRRCLLLEDRCRKYENRASEWVSAVFLVRGHHRSLVEIARDTEPWRHDAAMQRVAQALRDTKFDMHVDAALPGRNDRCPCGSGRKFKKCHGR